MQSNAYVLDVCAYFKVNDAGSGNDSYLLACSEVDGELYLFEFKNDSNHICDESNLIPGSPRIFGCNDAQTTFVVTYCPGTHVWW